VIWGLPAVVFAGAYEPDRDGKTIFRANCAACHGYDGTGGGRHHWGGWGGGDGGYTSFVDETESQDIQGEWSGNVRDFIRNGTGIVMPGFSVEEISQNEEDTLADCINNETCLGNDIYPDPAYQHNVNVIDEDPWFSPYTLAVPSLPATVRFVNLGQTWHTVTEATFLTNASNPAGSNSGLFGRGGKFFVTFTTAGTKKYYCMLHPFMQIQVCAGSGTCTAPAAPSPSPTKPLPTTPGVGELWVAVQGIDVPGKPVDTGADKLAFPDLPGTADDFVKDGEVQVINLTNYSIQHVPSNPANNTMNNPHYIWARKGTTEMVVTNYLDNYFTMFNASTKAVTVSRFYWGATTSHVTGEFDGSPLWGPVQGDYGVRTLTPGSSIGSWSRGSLRRITTTDSAGHTGSMPHGIWAGGSGGKTHLTANSRSNNTTVFNTAAGTQATCTMGPFPLNPGITASGSTLATTNVTNPTTSPSSLSIRTGSTGSNLCGTSGELRVALLGSGPVQTPPSPDDRFLAVSNGPYISVIDLAANFPTGSTCAGSSTFRTSQGYRICDINESVYGAHGVAWGQRGDGGSGWRIYMPGKFVDFVSVTDVTYTGSPTNGPVVIAHVGDIPVLKYAGGTCTKRALAGCTDTVPQGVTTKPLPAPWQ
jgi:plastocyanin